MRRTLPFFLLALLALQPCLAKERPVTLRVHIEANIHDGDVFASAIPAQIFGHNVVLQKTASISEFDVTAYQPYRAADGSYGALLQLDEHGKMALDALSIEQRGRSLFVFVNGRAITELQVDRRVSDGKIYLPSGLTAADIASMQKRWRLIAPHTK